MMRDRESVVPARSEVAAQALADLAYMDRSRAARVAEAIGVAAAGAIPWLGAIPAAAKAIREGDMAEEQRRVMTQWLDSHEIRIIHLGRDVAWVIDRIEQLGDEAMERAESPEFLKLVHKAFAAWDRADTDEKRAYFSRLLVNHAGAPLTSHDIARLFIEWVDRYHEAHFQIVSYVFNHRGCTKRSVGIDLLGLPLPADATAQAGLFRELWRELNMGGIVRQQRQVDASRRFLRKARSHTPKGQASPYVDTSFDDDDEVELSELGAQFVHYVLTDAVSKLSAG